MFRGKFLAALSRAHQGGQIERDPQGDAMAWADRLKELYRHGWVVYAKTPLGGPSQVLEYLSRYTHRTAIGNERIKAVTHKEVVFTVRADDQGKKRTVRLEGVEFVRRFLLHVLPKGGGVGAGVHGARGQAGGDAVPVLRRQHAQGGGDVDRVQAVTDTRGSRGGATPGAAVSHPAKRQRIRKFAPYSVLGAVPRPTLSGSPAPQGASLVSDKNKGQHRDWDNLHGPQRRWAGS